MSAPDPFARTVPAAEGGQGRPQHAAPVNLRTVAGWVGAELDLPPGKPAPDITGVTLDSRAVQPGDLYAAAPGTRVHGADFASTAVSAGAVAVLTDPIGAAQLGDLRVPRCLVDDPRAVLGRVAAGVYGEPARALTTLGVTGTHGKTTTTFLLEAGLRAAGAVPAVVGTVGTRIAGHPVKTALTTPEAPELHALFAVMREQGVSTCAMEVSSHALVMRRVDGVVFDLAVFLNLGRDHLDFHRDVEDYFTAKAALFTPERARRALLNVDDAYGRRLQEGCPLPVTTFSARGGRADWRCVDVRTRPEGSQFTVVGPDRVRHPATLRLPGAFNVSNALAAVAAGAMAGYDTAALLAGLAELPGVPGRMEGVDAGQDFVVLVDYAHKPDAVTAALSALRAVTPGRVIVVLGAGGDRDRGKRLLMGEAAAALADVVVVTDDNPRTEDPAQIRAALLAGTTAVPVADRGEVVEVAGRAEAITAALGQARAGDCVLIAGKGHEQGQEVDGVVYPFDDRAAAEAALRRLGGTR